MSVVQLEIQLVAALVAASAALVGVFLVLRRMAMMSDAISHSILLGIVLAFFVTEDLASPLLLVGAALMGIATVFLVEALAQTRIVAKDASIGLVFPALFSAGVILIARYAGGVHLDIDAVLLGELAFVPFDRFVVGGYDLGPRAAYVVGSILLVDVAFVALFYKELKLATFDPALAGALGLSPVVVHYSLMAATSLTAVGAFDAVGSVLVVALMVAPPAAAYLLTDRLPHMVALSIGLAVLSAIGGFWLAHALDASIAGAMASAAGIVFVASFVLAPGRGLLASARRTVRHRWDFAQAMLVIHLLHHEGAVDVERESRMEHLEEGLHWEPGFATSVVGRARKRGLVLVDGDRLVLTECGRNLAREAAVA